MKNFLEKHRKVFGFIGLFGALTIGTVYYFIVPQEAAKADVIQKTILTYGHSSCWILLGIASLFWGLGKTRKMAYVFAYVALGVYAIFVAVLVAKAL